jgi:hypothetical protein
MTPQQRKMHAAKNQRRLWLGHEYGGKIGFTQDETKEIIHGTTDRPRHP